MSDIVERIAAYLEDAPGDGGHSDAAGGNCWELLREAADEIERLRKRCEGHRRITAAQGDEIERLRGRIAELQYEGGMYQSLYEQAKSGTPHAQCIDGTAETTDKTGA